MKRTMGSFMSTRNKTFFLALGLSGLVIVVALGWSAARVGIPGIGTSSLVSQCQVIAQLDSPYPGMVWIEGGSFIMGSPDLYVEQDL